MALYIHDARIHIMLLKQFKYTVHGYGKVVLCGSRVRVKNAVEKLRAIPWFNLEHYYEKYMDAVGIVNFTITRDYDRYDEAVSFTDNLVGLLEESDNIRGVEVYDLTLTERPDDITVYDSNVNILLLNRNMSYLLYEYGRFVAVVNKNILPNIIRELERIDGIVEHSIDYNGAIILVARIESKIVSNELKTLKEIAREHLDELARSPIVHVRYYDLTDYCVDW